MLKPIKRNEQFASDNNSGMCPEAVEYLLKANQDDEPAYGNDKWTKLLHTKFESVFETACDSFLVFTGTAANSLALASMCQSYHSVICHEFAHIETDECGGPEYASNGAKLILGIGELGKLTLKSVEALTTRRTDIHFPKPKVVSLTQSTEFGTVYSLGEIREIADFAKSRNMGVHMDGARFANALVSLKCSPAELSWKSGVDVLCFSGTKNGLAFGDVVIIFNKALSTDFLYRMKQAGQLASKMSFLSAPWIGLLENDTWISNARRANDAAQYLSERLRTIPEVRIKYPVEANAVFVEMPEKMLDTLRSNRWIFYTFIGDGGARFVCNWSSTNERIDELIRSMKAAEASL